MIYVKDVMAHRVRTIESGLSIRDAAKAMAKWKIGSLIIMEGSRPVGMVTEGDISKAVARGLNPDTTKLQSQKKKLVVAGPADKLEEAARKMASSGVKKLPVVEGGKLVGMITQTDIVGSSFALVTSLKEMVQARYRPPDFEM